ncbi:[FeFe] hydrogenase (group B1/B3) [Elusimicrobium simillimum]|uniref:4Fe-4S dicluster domain-containing protein n=1 Tax=Elusimicrobium simillimum TaxID=3143438 RepID=UPI003C6EAF97
MIKRKANNSEHFKREVLVEISKMFFNGTLERDIHKIPFNIIPSGSEAQFRCCVFKERAILSSRVLAAMGYSINEVDESRHLNEYVSEQQDLKNGEGKLLIILRSACQACVKSQYLVTEVCQGCLARPCISECPFGAVSMVNGRSRIDPDKCKNCGKCKNACPYGAILKLNVPCEDACPVKAIKKDEKGHAVIDHSICISCGRCMKSCPFGAVMERSQLLNVLRSFKDKKPVVAMIAPAIAGQFGVSMGKLTSALKAVGFDSVYEVAYGAEITAANEAKEFKERVIEKGEKFMTSSCCFAYLRLVQKHIPELKPFVSHTATPMHYTAELVKKEMPEAVTVFVGPCLSKRKEGQVDPLVDYVLNFEELYAIFTAKDVNFETIEEAKLDKRPNAASLRFPLAGGVTKAVREAARGPLGINAEIINGVDEKTIFKLKAYCKGSCPHNFIEVMSCLGGCVGGPDVIKNKIQAAVEVEKYATEQEK